MELDRPPEEPTVNKHWPSSNASVQKFVKLQSCGRPKHFASYKSLKNSRPANVVALLGALGALKPPA